VQTSHFFTLIANQQSVLRKAYIPHDGTEEDTMATKKTHPLHISMPMYWRQLMEKESPNAAQLGDLREDQLAVCTPPVLCWLCGAGFLCHSELFKHCETCEAMRLEKGDYAEYRKRVLWEFQRAGPRPLRPWIKRHILQSATFHLTHSIPSSFSLHWHHPSPFTVAVPRQEKACVVCARMDWIERRLPVYLWRSSTTTRRQSEIFHRRDTGNAEDPDFLASGDAVCFADSDCINEFLATHKYIELMPSIPPEELYASSVVHPRFPHMTWLLHSRRVPMQSHNRVTVSVPREQSGDNNAAQPEKTYRCAGVGDLDEISWICWNCATSLCTPQKKHKMPSHGLCNLLWGGRERRQLQGRLLGLRMLLGAGRSLYRKLILGHGAKEDLQAGFAGNHVLISQPRPSCRETIPPTAEDLGENFVCLFGTSIEEVHKCQILQVNRQDYIDLAHERKQCNPYFGEVCIDEQLIQTLPAHGVPPQILANASRIPEVATFEATSVGPGTLPSVIDAPAQQPDNAAEDSDGEHEPVQEPQCDHNAGPTSETTNAYETALGLDPSCDPSVVQHLTAFTTQLNLLKQQAHNTLDRQNETTVHTHGSAEQPDNPNIQAATREAANQEQTRTIIIDLKEAAAKLNNPAQLNKFESQMAHIEKVEQGLFVPGGTALSMFDPKSWTWCCADFWFADCLPNDPRRPEPLSFEQLTKRSEITFVHTWRCETTKALLC